MPCGPTGQPLGDRVVELAKHVAELAQAEEGFGRETSRDVSKTTKRKRSVTFPREPLYAGTIRSSPLKRTTDTS